MTIIDAPHESAIASAVAMTRKKPGIPEIAPPTELLLPDRGERETPAIVLRDIQVDSSMMSPWCAICHEQLENHGGGVGVYVRQPERRTDGMERLQLLDHPLCPWCGTRDAGTIRAGLVRFMDEAADSLVESRNDRIAATDSRKRASEIENMGVFARAISTLAYALCLDAAPLVGTKDQIKP